MNKKALVIGINAYDPPNALPSCINDADAMASLLTNSYGFQSITNLRDKDASKAAILGALRGLLSGAQPGDTLVFYFSGHGYSYPSGTTLVEALVPQDADFLTCDEFADATNGAPVDSLTVVLDSCYSGGMQKAFAKVAGVKPVLVKFWTAPHEQEQKAFAPEQLPILTYSAFGSLSRPILSTSLVIATPSVGKAFSIIKPADAGNDCRFILLSACQADETAAASTERTDGRSAFTFALLDQIASNPAIGAGDLLDGAGRELRQLGVRQTPMLKVPAAPADLADHAFLLWDQPIPKVAGKSPQFALGRSSPPSSETKGFTMNAQAYNKDWMSDITTIVQTVTPLVAGALKDYRPPSKGFVPNGANGVDKGWFDDLTRVVATIIPAVVQGMKDFEPPTKGFSASGPQPFDKGWFDNITSIAAAIIPEVVSTLKGYQAPNGQLSEVAAAAQKGWFDDVTHVVASVLPVIISATKDMQIAGVSSKGFQPPTEDDKGWLSVLGDIAKVAVPIAIAAL